MTDTLQTTPEVGGMGHRMKRKEDPRFIQGKGNYIDDVKLPGMLYLDIVRSPYAHAKILKIDASEALKIPGVLAVITGKDLEGRNLHWMPTLVATRRWCCRSTRWSTTPRKWRRSSPPTATSPPTALQRSTSITSRCRWWSIPFEALQVVDHAPTRRGQETNHIWHWEAGDPKRPSRVRRGRGASSSTCTSRASTSPRSKPAAWSPTGTRSAAAHADMTSQAPARHPHGVRAGPARWACRSPSRRSRSSRPISAAASAARCRSTPAMSAPCRRLVAHRQAGQVDRGSQREPAGRLVRPRLPHRRRDGGDARMARSPALRVKTLADHGYADAAANPSKFPAGLYSIATGSYDYESGPSSRSMASTPTSRPAASPTAARSASPKRST